MNKDFIKGVNIALGFIFVFSFLGIVSAVGFHYADEVFPGTFTGNYEFEGSLNMSLDQNGATTLRVKNNVDGGSAESRIYLLGNNGGGTLTYYSPSYNIAGRAHYADKVVLTSDSASNGLGLTSSSATGDIIFYTGGDQSTNERMRILSNGNVGIGTSTSGHKLQVLDDSSTWGATFTNLNPAGSGLLINAATGGEEALRVRDYQDNDLFTVDGNGKVGIGTYTPDSQLTVVGGDFKIQNYVSNQPTISLDIQPGQGITIFATTTGCGASQQIGADSGRYLCWDAN